MASLTTQGVALSTDHAKALFDMTQAFRKATGTSVSQSVVIRRAIEVLAAHLAANGISKAEGDRVVYLRSMKD